jgi:hypothetical protein
MAIACWRTHAVLSPCHHGCVGRTRCPLLRLDTNTFRRTLCGDRFQFYRSLLHQVSRSLPVAVRRVLCTCSGVVCDDNHGEAGLRADLRQPIFVNFRLLFDLSERQKATPKRHKATPIWVCKRRLVRPWTLLSSNLHPPRIYGLGASACLGQISTPNLRTFSRITQVHSVVAAAL